MKHLLALLVTLSFNANADVVRAWYSAGTTCSGGTQITYTPGEPFTVSFCAQWSGSVCGFGLMPEVAPGSSGHFSVLSRTLNPAFPDGIDNLPASVPIVSDPFGPAHKMWGIDFGGISNGSAYTYADHPLVILTMVGNGIGREVVFAAPISGMVMARAALDMPNHPCSNPYDAPYDLVPLTLDTARVAPVAVVTLKPVIVKKTGARAKTVAPKQRVAP